MARSQDVVKNKFWMFNEKTEKMRSSLSRVELELNSLFGWRTTAQPSNIPLLETSQLVSIKLVSEQLQTGLNWAEQDQLKPVINTEISHSLHKAHIFYFWGIR